VPNSAPVGYPEEEAIREVLEIEREHLTLPRFGGLASLAMRATASATPGAATIPDASLRAIYFNALLDLHMLVVRHTLRRSVTAPASQTETVTGDDAIHATEPTKTATPRQSSTIRIRRDGSLALIPAKKRAAAKRTTPST
jgi:hypothetical protein